VLENAIVKIHKTRGWISLLVEQELDYMKRTHYHVKDISKYVWFHNDPMNNKPKTEVWDILSKSGNVLLGRVKYFANWRQYCFFPEGGCIFSKGCMNDINNFIEELNKVQRLTNKSPNPSSEDSYSVLGWYCL
jgi:hypothetical protein